MGRQLGGCSSWAGPNVSADVDAIRWALLNRGAAPSLVGHTKSRNGEMGNEEIGNKEMNIDLSTHAHKWHVPKMA